MEEIRSDKTHHDSIQKKVFSEKVNILHNNLLTSVPANFICGFIVFISLYQDQNATSILAWFFVLVFVSLFRLVAAYFYQHSVKNDKRHLLIFMLGMTASAVLWGVIGSVLMPHDLMHQMVVIVVIAGVTAGGVQTLNANVRASLVYLCVIMVPVSIWIFFQASFAYTLLGMTMLVYLGFMIVTSIRGNQLLTTIFFLQYENQVLIEKISTFNAKLVDYSKTLYEQSIHDSLTGLFNRRYLDETLPRELQRALREKQTLCVAMLDLDFFKTFNDTHGHSAGDAMLRFIGALMQETFRGSDISCRYGGEEFLVVLINTDMASAQTRLERFRETIKNEKVLFHGKFLPSITVSIGLAEAPGHGIEAEDIVSAADRALYYAKELGRDRTECAVQMADNRISRL